MRDCLYSDNTATARSLLRLYNFSHSHFCPKFSQLTATTPFNLFSRALPPLNLTSNNPGYNTSKPQPIVPKVLTRKNRDPMLEKRTVPMLIGESKEEFHVHEEKLCLNAPYFRRKPQSKRKSLEHEADRECSICQESTDVDQDSLSSSVHVNAA